MYIINVSLFVENVGVAAQHKLLRLLNTLVKRILSIKREPTIIKKQHSHPHFHLVINHKLMHYSASHHERKAMDDYWTLSNLEEEMPTGSSAMFYISLAIHSSPITYTEKVTDSPLPAYSIGPLSALQCQMEFHWRADRSPLLYAE